ncbi:unnamed protein product [Leptidea sinapis]|uniref:Complex I-15 kDa n=1 Tax=Leptidea sinapis TaxID=189913 RepID=A0A5E4Q5D0_9NEOP|nr:unnamed protein product [Leptidea sinapis]
MGEIAPFLRSIFTDVTGCMLNHQMLGKCARQEMQMMDCFEAYGLDKGLRKCTDFIDELYECQTKKKQFARFVKWENQRI